MPPTIHASAVLVGARAVLIRGPSGAGKSSLALALIEQGETGRIASGRLVADDRAHLEAANGRLIVRPATDLRGLIEIRGFGIRTLPFEPAAIVGLVVDLAAADAERLPPPERQWTEIEGVRLARLAVAPGADPLPGTLATLYTASRGA